MLDPLTLGLTLGSLFLIGNGLKATSIKTVPNEIESEVLERLRDATRITVPSLDTWVEVPLGTERWLVAPRYIAPIGIGEAVKVARLNGAQLPSKALVDAIWQAADLKLEPRPRGANSNPPSDFTRKTMDSPEAHIDQLAIIAKQIQQSDNPNFRLLAGTHKDVVMQDGKVGIYGWHRLNGKPIQDFFTGHAHGDSPELDWKDYSQGLRLVKKIG